MCKKKVLEKKKKHRGREEKKQKGKIYSDIHESGGCFILQCFII